MPHCVEQVQTALSRRAEALSQGLSHLPERRHYIPLKAIHRRELSKFAAVPTLCEVVQMNGMGQRAAFCATLMAVLGGVGAQQYQH